MADFYQNGSVATLHNLGQRTTEDLEDELRVFSKERPMGLVLPSLYSELQTDALEGIVQELKKVDYLEQIIIGLDRADQAEYQHALEYFGRLPQDHTVLWNDGPRLREIDALLEAQNLAPAEPGKGRNVWFCFGYALACKRSKAIALHDCDVKTYNRSLLARLIYPIANPNFNYEFSKGYYSRVADQKLNGRVCRLLVPPLIRSLKKVCKGHDEFLDYLDSFRYALAGEFAMSAQVLNDIRIPSDWGLEIGVLSEMKRNYNVNHICQVDIADIYDHKHQILSPEDKAKGLSKMSIDISKSLFRKLAIEGQVFSPEVFRTIKATYYRIALDMVKRYAADSALNGLDYDNHGEGSSVELFAENIMEAGQLFMDNTMDTPFMPSWNRVISAFPDILERLKTAVEEDTKEFTNS